MNRMPQADYAELITFLRKDLNAHSSAVIGFGGSYGAHEDPSGPSSILAW